MQEFIDDDLSDSSNLLEVDKIANLLQEAVDVSSPSKRPPAGTRVFPHFNIDDDSDVDDIANNGSVPGDGTCEIASDRSLTL